MRRGQILLVAPKTMLILAIFWSLSLMLFIGFGIFDLEQLDFAVNVFELVYGLLAGSMVLIFSRITVNRLNRYNLLGTALAIFSWTLGQIYWFSYTSITGEILPYPSVGDMGFTGTYFLLIGVIEMIVSGQPITQRRYYSYTVFLVMLIPVLLLFVGKSKIEVMIFNFILAFAVSFTLFKNFMLLENQKYRWFVGGIFLLGITDVVFMISASLFPNTYTFSSDVLYPISLSLIATGILKGGYGSHD